MEEEIQFLKDFHQKEARVKSEEMRKARTKSEETRYHVTSENNLPLESSRSNRFSHKNNNLTIEYE